MLYTPKYIHNNDLDKKICDCGECKKYRILYCHSDVVEDVYQKVSDSDMIVTCSKCRKMFRFGLKSIVLNKESTYNVGKINEIKENYDAVRENISRNYNSFDSIHTIKSDDYLTKLIKEGEQDSYNVLEYVFIEK